MLEEAMIEGECQWIIGTHNAEQGYHRVVSLFWIWHDERTLESETFVTYLQFCSPVSSPKYVLSVSQQGLNVSFLS